MVTLLTNINISYDIYIYIYRVLYIMSTVPIVRYWWRWIKLPFSYFFVINNKKPHPVGTVCFLSFFFLFSSFQFPHPRLPSCMLLYCIVLSRIGGGGKGRCPLIRLIRERGHFHNIVMDVGWWMMIMIESNGIRIRSILMPTDLLTRPIQTTKNKQSPSIQFSILKFNVKIQFQ